MIRIAQVLMAMDDLRDRKKGQKGHAKDSDHREGARPWTVSCCVSVESSQPCPLSFRIHGF